MESVTVYEQKKAELLDYDEDPHLSPEVRAFLKRFNGGGPPMESLSVVDARKVFAGLQASVEVDLSGIEVSEEVITTDDDYTVRLHFVRPAGVKGVLPAFLFIPGGGWALADFATHQRLVRDLVTCSGCAAVFVNYTNTPDAEYPFAIQEIYAITKWVVKNGQDIYVDGKNLAVVGNGAGGNLAAALALMASLQCGPEIRLQVLMWPATDACFDTESYGLYGRQRFLTASLMKWMYDLYDPEAKKRKEIYLSPLQATLAELQGVPPALIQVAENDILRDEAEAYGRKLELAGVRVTTVRYNGVIHAFGLLNPLADLHQTHSLILHAATALRRYLHHSDSHQITGA